VGIAAAYQAGEILRNYYGRVFETHKKGVADLVTEADIRSEKLIIETIQAEFPDHGILAEESGLRKGLTNCQWIIDPLDGTTNFAHHLNLCSVSIAFASEGNTRVGIVLSPLNGELFTATQGEGADLNGRQITVSDTATVAESLLVTGFPYNFRENPAPLLARFSNCLKAAQGIRRLGSAALDLCFVACGRFDAFWEQNLKPWDTAAGVLIAREAGARVSDFSDRPFTVDKKEMLASNGNIHNEMLSLLEIKGTE
jgi:myo-inositol-1(or 4)-monophosphatase